MPPASLPPKNRRKRVTTLFLRIFQSTINPSLFLKFNVSNIFPPLPKKSKKIITKLLEKIETQSSISSKWTTKRSVQARFFYRTPRLSNTYNQFGLEHRLLKRCFRYAHVSTEACAHVSYKRPPFRINREVNTTRIEIPVVVTPDIDASSTFSNSIDKTNLSLYWTNTIFILLLF